MAAAALQRMTAAAALPVRLDDVIAAGARLEGRVNRTPVLTSRTANQRSSLPGCELAVHFKAEFLQRTGSFKIRGATNAVLCLGEAEASKGVVTHSSGNHGQAVALAATLRGIPSTVVVPRTTPQCKVDAIAGYGASVTLCEPTQASRAETARLEAERLGGATIVPPYNHPDVIAGQGTIAVEMLEQVSQGLDAIIVPTSGGGMIAGIAAAAKALRPGIRVFAVEPAGKRLADSLSTATRVICPERANALLDTCADAIRTQAIGEVPWPMVHSLVDPLVFSVNDAQIAEAMKFAFERMKIVIEPAAATGIAALLDGQVARALVEEGKQKGAPLHVGVVLCGGNVDLSHPLPWMNV